MCKRTGDEDLYYYFNGVDLGSASESSKAFETAIWDFGGKLTGMKQGE